MKPIVKTRLSSATTVVIPIRPRLDSTANRSLTSLIVELDNLLLSSLRRWSITALRLALGSVFLWFGALKIFGNSPVASLIRDTYTFVPVSIFILVLGVWEMLIGIGIVLKRALRCVLILLCVHLVGTFTAMWLKPSVFFVGLPFCLTGDGEFVIKNVVLITAALVIAGHQVKPLGRC
jgi:Predicted membrane protein